MVFPHYEPILDAYRSNYIDNRFFGLIFLFGKNGLIKKVGNSNGAKFFLRSLMKPIQASILNERIISHFNFTSQELAVMQGSHAGEPCHIKLVQSILDKIGAPIESLLCPPIEPLNTGIYVGRVFSKLHNNCSGKHAMMLSFCKYMGYDAKAYTDYSHPLQEKIREKLINYSETSDFIYTKDGCTVPVYALRIENIAKCFLNYYSDKKNSTLISAYMKNPYIVGGCDNSGKRTDTKIMELSPILASKVGAGGFIYVYNFKKEQILIVKMAQNNNPAREIVTLEVLYRLGWIKTPEYDENIYTEANEPIGKYVLNTEKGAF